jgi:hypothetical protein
MARSAILFFFLIGCTTHAPEKPVEPPATTAPPSIASAAPAKVEDPRLVPDEAVGPLIAKLSENAGDFPSENYVSNELSLLDVADDLRSPALKGRAYVGVGPEQNYTYLGILEPKVAYIVDIRRGNLLEHLFFRGCFEKAKTPAEFLAALFDDDVARTKAVMDRLGVVHSKEDDKVLARIQAAFAKHRLAIAYTMLGNGRTYPTLGETLALRGSFTESDEAYARVRKLVVENRVLPIVGDFGGKHALHAVAEDMRERGLLLGLFYGSNVEQYLFDGKKHVAFTKSIEAMPRDAESRMVRVWFDQGRPHPDQRPKVRTTQVVMRADAFIAGAPYKSYWDLVTKRLP